MILNTEHGIKRTNQNGVRFSLFLFHIAAGGTRLWGLEGIALHCLSPRQTSHRIFPTYPVRYCKTQGTFRVISEGLSHALTMLLTTWLAEKVQTELVDQIEDSLSDP